MEGKKKLTKELGLFDVFAISTGAMFSSGFFLLPGLASQYTGPSVFVAYLVSGLLILPAMFSMAEIATALPRAGGAYFFLDRSLGPLMGTIGGLGTYLSLVFKTAFAIIGIGAYAAIFWDVPVQLVAVAATMVFTGLNLIGAKKTSGLQNFFIIFLLVVLGGFVFEGLYTVFFTERIEGPSANEHFTPFFTNGIEGIITTAGFVFVSYLGLTKVASVAEEIKNPERNIPLGMLLSLVITSVIYFLGVFVMVALIDPKDFANELAPAATAAKQLFKWMPGQTGAYLMVGAAMAAFASTGNAGLLSSSRYPFAMARDKLFPPRFARVGKSGTPILSILFTSGLVLFLILVVSEEGIAKLASAFQLFIFMLINFSVIVFRKSNIESYDPGYKSPWYPGMQIAGIFVSLVLIVYMGWMAVIFSGIVTLLSFLWYYYYAREKVKREGAIFHWFALLGKYQYSELENEFMTILKEKGLRQGDPFDETITRARITSLEKDVEFDDLVAHVAEVFSTEMHASKETLINEFMTTSAIEPALIIPEVSILYAKSEGVDHPSLHIVLSSRGIRKPVGKGGISSEDYIRIFFFLVNPPSDSRQQLRMLSRLVDIIEREEFVEEMFDHKSHRKIKEYLLHNERFFTVRLLPQSAQFELVGKKLKEISLPPDVLVALIERDSETFAPHGDTVLEEHDALTLIGEPKSIAQLFDKYLKQ
ncbi:amino acid transporter [Marinilabilia salmonicolor]|jgi:amino acid transporter/mannitol/fructose-specific phosphotransferase system IIA component (Ntr-type)|uniref:amino acid permease n=1 Tax=Marinilabilia salmonicolor TaxID=989 RepID=UPI000D079CC7|nr:amino acid permease [Marinilabilia salmonicolor]PRZ00674.1 amino acid transporter [Marinilabilia salmonicolor]